MWTETQVADMYAKGANEVLIGQVLKEGNNRERVFLVTKFGNRWTGLENTTKLGGATAAVISFCPPTHDSTSR